jgi:hypothetical protein
MPEHKGQTDEVKKIELPSAIQQVMWSKQMIAGGAQVGLEIFTHYVGNNSDIEIEFSDHSGKKFGTSKSKISGNHLLLQILVPADAGQIFYAEVKLPKHGLNKKSNPLLILPKIEISNLKWDKKEARRGDILKLTADVKGAQEGSEAEIEIWEHDEDKAHDLITKIPVTVKSDKVETNWEYEYYEDTDDIPSKEETEKGYNPPEYFFRVIINGTSADSGLLEFKDWIDIELKNQLEKPIPDEKYELTLPDGTQRKGTLDKEGKAVEKDVPPGKCVVTFPEL